MAQQSVRRNIILSGQVTNGFDALVTKMESLASVVNQVSTKIEQLGEDSLETYKNYERNIQEARGVYTNFYNSASKADRIMTVLEEKAHEWASTTIFHTDDVSGAINNAAHAGWSLEEQLEGIPAAMKLAQAGSLDLAQGVSYLARGLNVTGTDFKDSTEFIDQWVKASTLADLTIEDIGETLAGMGMTGRWAGTNKNLFAMIDALAAVGSTGSQAGTQLRAAMIRLIAPTNKAEKAIESLSLKPEQTAELQAELDAMREAGEFEKLPALQNAIDQLGVHVYDEKGNLRDFVDILTDMSTAIQAMDSPEERNALIKDIFPTRNFATAQALLQGMVDGTLPDYLEAIEDSGGAAERASKIMMDSLFGDIETLKSKWEEFEIQIGESLSGPVRDVAGVLGDMLDKINALDEPSFSALVAGLGSIAGMGASLAFGSGVLKFFGALGPYATAAVLAGAGMAALYTYLTKLSDENWEANFGDIALDLEQLGDAVDAQKTPFDEAKESIAEWETQVQEAQAVYQELGSDLSSGMLQAALSNQQLTQTEIENIKGYGEQIGKQVLAGIESAGGRDTGFLETIFGGDSEITGVVGNWYQSVYDDAYDIGAELREQLTAALTDKILDENEREAIQATLDRLNEIQAQITNETDQAAFYARLRSAQRVSWDSFSEYAQQTGAQYTADKAEVENTFDRLYGVTMAAYDREIAAGTKSEADRAAALAELDAQEAAAMQDVTDKFSQIMQTAMTAILNDGGWKEGVEAALTVLRMADAREFGSGALTLDDVNFGALSGLFGDEAIAQLFGLSEGQGRLKGLFGQYSELPGVSEMLDVLSYAYEIGLGLQSGQDAWETYQTYGGQIDDNNWFSTPEQRAAAERYHELPGLIENAQGYLEYLNAELERAYARHDQKSQSGSVAGQETQYAREADLRGKIAEAQAQLQALEDELAGYKGKVPITLSPDGKTAAQQYLQQVNSNKETISWPVYWEIVQGGGGEGLEGFANGGRADSPSIFGEAGAEWAIPEEHSLRTASLLNQTREASGFTWGELNALSGGTQSASVPKSVEIHITYSPNVNAADATGVEGVLSADKERMKRMVRQAIEEAQMQERAAALA